LPKSIQSIQPPLKFIPPRFNAVILQIAKGLLPVLLRLRLRPWLPAGIIHIEAKNAEVLAQLYQQFQVGKIRFLLAFRHPEVDDPLCMFYLLSRIVPQVARQQGIRLKYPAHSHFLYDRGMTLWAGDWLGWFFSRLGGVAIRRGKRLDRQGIQTARELFANSSMPIAVAPEGGTNGHSGFVSPLEPGVSQLGFWCVEDLAKAQRPETVFIIPIAIKYRYVKPPWSKLEWLLRKLEAKSGLPISSDDHSANEQSEIYYQRLYRLAEHVISEMEDFYRRFYHKNLLPIPNQDINSRLHRLMDTALQVPEQYFNIQPQGNFIDRCRRLEEAGWSYIYREDVADIAALPPMQRGLADWIAQEADLRMRHMRLVESFVAVTCNYLQAQPTAERFAETALIMFDLLSRISERKTPARPRLGWRTAMITVGEPISVTERWKNSQSDRQATRRATSQLTQDLQVALEQLISC
jgi:1-acyl-sn-glycerol-3-phosphate acyltransferase